MDVPGGKCDKYIEISERKRLKTADKAFLPPNSNFKADESYFLKVEGNLKFEDVHGPSSLDNVIRKEFVARVIDIESFFDECAKMLTKIQKASWATIVIASSPEARLHRFRHLEFWGTAEQVRNAERHIINVMTKKRFRSPAPTILMPVPICRHEAYIPLCQASKLFGINFEHVEKLETRCGAWIKLDPLRSPTTGYIWMRRVVIFGSREQIYQAMAIINSAVLEPYVAPLSSLSPVIFVQNGFTGVRTQIESVAPKTEGACKSVATSSTEQTAYKTRVSRNVNIAKRQAGYLFQEIGRRKAAHMLKYPDAQVISLGIDDATKPIPEVSACAMHLSAFGLHGLHFTFEGCSVYEAEQGGKQLRAQLASTFYATLGIEEDDIFLSDDAQSDISRLQVLFGSNVTMAVQDPSYPAYVDSSVIFENLANIKYMKCTSENGFFPDLSEVSRTDIIYFCSPNNPTGCAASREQLTKLVNFAKDNGSIIVYDSAYAMYVSGDTPKSIFEIPGAKEVAIEIASFSKCAGFTGVRVGWTVVPKELKYSDGFSVAEDFNRIGCTGFNGLSNIAQAGGLACLSPEGLKAMHEVVGFYKENTKIIVDTFTSLGFHVYGGIHAPYVWVHFPGRSSWDIFSEILEKTHVVTTPGSGFGPAGEGFVRVSAFGHRDVVLEACSRFKEVYTSEKMNHSISCCI